MGLTPYVTISRSENNPRRRYISNRNLPPAEQGFDAINNSLANAHYIFLPLQETVLVSGCSGDYLHVGNSRQGGIGKVKMAIQWIWSCLFSRGRMRKASASLLKHTR